MLSPSAFRELLSGHRRGAIPALLRAGLRLAEVPYTWAVRWRNHRYDTGAATVHRIDRPVLSVGNLTLGGTGKTPMVEWLARWFTRQGIAVAVVSRGYGARRGGPNDEARELAWKLPDVPHVQNPDRVAAARQAIAEHGSRLILLDDGFQHRRLHRDLDIVLLDALEPFGFEHVFPRGTLREPIEGLARAQIVALSRADLLTPADRESLRQRTAALAPEALWIETAHMARGILTPDRNQLPLSSLAGRRVLAFCGIGNPAGFRHTLSGCGCEVAEQRVFADHHDYRPGDLASLAADAVRLGADALVCTQKDLVKLEKMTPVRKRGRESFATQWPGGCFAQMTPDPFFRPLWALEIGLEILAGREPLEARLAAAGGLSSSTGHRGNDLGRRP